MPRLPEPNWPPLMFGISRWDHGISFRCEYRIPKNGLHSNALGVFPSLLSR